MANFDSDSVDKQNFDYCMINLKTASGDVKSIHRVKYISIKNILMDQHFESFLFNGTV